MSDESGKCATCGLLGIREGHVGSPYAKGIPQEIETSLRAAGNVYWISKGSSQIEGVLSCSVGHADLHREALKAKTESISQQKAAIQILEDPRNCPHWFPYSPGMSPSEHLEQRRLLEFAERQERFHDRLLDEQKSYFNGLELSRRKWEEEREAANERQARRARLTEFVLVIIAILIALPGLLFSQADCDHSVILNLLSGTDQSSQPIFP